MRLNELFDNDQTTILLVDETAQKFTKIGKAGLKSAKEYSFDTGIMSLVMKQRDIVSIAEAYHHPLFNSKVDINTNLPVILLPIFSKYNPPRI